jgi:hypothetical protein
VLTTLLIPESLCRTGQRFASNDDRLALNTRPKTA